MRAFATSREIAEQLKSRIGYGIGQNDLAKELGVSCSYLSDFLSGRREAGPKILAALGYEVVPFFRKAKP